MTFISFLLFVEHFTFLDFDFSVTLVVLFIDICLFLFLTDFPPLCINEFWEKHECKLTIPLKEGQTLLMGNTLTLPMNGFYKSSCHFLLTFAIKH